MKLEKGTIISHYEILSEIGKGGMGEVYLAQDTELDRKVAIKFLSEDFSGDVEKLNRFIQEAKATSALNHPNILTVHQIGEVEGTRFIATEFIEGKTLREHLSSKQTLSLNQILKTGVQVAEALSAAHQAGIIHRDIKPENVMIRADGYVKVLDFGLAKLIEKKGAKNEEREATGEDESTLSLSPDPPVARSPHQTAPGMVMGTVSYMSPEQAQGKPTDERTDLWSLGVVLYEMLAGKVPFTGKTINHTIVAILETEPKLFGNVPDELNRIVRKTLTKDKDNRYQTARDLLIDLKNLRRDLDIRGELERSFVPNREVTDQVQENETAIYRSKTLGETKAESGGIVTQNVATSSSLEYAVTRAKSHKLATAAIGIVLLSIISAVVYFAFFANRGNEAIRSIAVMPFVNESGNQDIEYLSDGMTETLISSLTEIPNLSVKASSTVFYYKGKNKTPGEIGKELGVEAVLLGKIRQRNDELTLRLELVDSKTLDALWSQSYERKTSDLVTLQSEIARNVSDKLRLKLTANEQKQVAKNMTANSEAQQLYLKGRFHWNKRNAEDLQKAIGYFKQAIEKDSGYVLAYVGLSDSYAVLPGYGAFRPREYGAKAKQAVQKALELDNDLAEAHASLAIVLREEYDWEGAEREFRKAIELNPNYATARQWYGGMLSNKGINDEAIKEITKALELDPLSRVINRNRGDFLYAADRYDEAISQLKKTIELFPDDMQSYDSLSRTYAAKGMYSEAVEQSLIEFKLGGMPPDEIRKYKELYEEKGWKGFCGKRLEGHLKYRQEVLAKDRNAYLPDADLALHYARLGEKEKTIEYLTRGFEERDHDLKNLKRYHEFDFLRDEPRFKELLRKIGLSE